MKEIIEKHVNDLRKLLEDYAKEHGIKVSLPRVTYDSTSGSFWGKLTCNIIKDTNERERREYERAYIRWRTGHHRFRNAYGETFIMQDMPLKIVALKPRNRKYPVIAMNVNDGKRYKFAAHQVLSRLNAQEGSS